MLSPFRNDRFELNGFNSEMCPRTTEEKSAQQAAFNIRNHPRGRRYKQDAQTANFGALLLRNTPVRRICKFTYIRAVPFHTAFEFAHAYIRLPRRCFGKRKALIFFGGVYGRDEKSRSHFPDCHCLLFRCGSRAKFRWSSPGPRRSQSESKCVKIDRAGPPDLSLRHV